MPSVSELIKVSRKDFKLMVLDGYESFIKKRRLSVPLDLIRKLDDHRSATKWEDGHTTPQEKFLLKSWFLMDHGLSVTQGLLNKGVMDPNFNFMKFLQS